MTGKRFHWGLVVVGLILGLMLSMQFRVAKEITANASMERMQRLQTEVQQATVERDQLRERLDELHDELDEIAATARQDRLRSQLELVRMHAGLLPVTGPGLEVTLNDSPAALQPGDNPNFLILHDEDLLKVLNELRAAGAEALAINNERILPSSGIRCAGPTVVVNRNRRLTPPFVITAVGDPDTMLAALEMRGGVLETLQFYNIQATAKKVDKVVVPAYTGSTTWNWAQRVSESEGMTDHER